MWKKIILSSYIVLTVASVVGATIGGLGWPDPAHIVLTLVSGLLFAVASVLHFKLMEVLKTDQRIYELEEDNKNLRTARRMDREEFRKMEERLQTLIKTRFNGIDLDSVTSYLEAADSSAPNFLEQAKTKVLSFIKK